MKNTIKWIDRTIGILVVTAYLSIGLLMRFGVLEIALGPWYTALEVTGALLTMQLGHFYLMSWLHPHEVAEFLNERSKFGRFLKTYWLNL